MTVEFVFDDAAKESLSPPTQKALILFPQMLANQENMLREYHKDNGEVEYNFCFGRAEQLAQVALTFPISGEAAMLLRSFFLIVSIGCSAATALSAAFAETEPKSVARQSLKSPSEFESIGDQAERSRAIFAEIGKLLTHPRCMSCHPAGDHPLQGADHHEHMPRVWRSDAENLGTHCAECHTDNNVTLHEAATYQSIPGHARWGLAPVSMAWEGKTIRDICRQLKDTSRNGGRDLAMLQEHVAKDDLVAWGWNPGLGREPAPGSQESAGELVQAWINSGAQCP